jgi:hypothetical protein
MLGARDYSVNAVVRVDMPFINILPNKAVIFFKQKNMLKVESKGISIIPKQGFNQLNYMLNDSSQYVCVDQGYGLINGTKVAIVNVLPVSDTSDLILGKLWIDPKREVIFRTQLTTRSNGTILVDYNYGSQLKYGLPDRLEFTLDMKKFKLPKVLGADINSSQSAGTEQKTTKKGKVYITLSGYKINMGIPDNFFTKKK